MKNSDPSLDDFAASVKELEAARQNLLDAEREAQAMKNRKEAAELNRRAADIRSRTDLNAMTDEQRALYWRQQIAAQR